MSWGCINQVQSSLHPKLSMVSIWEVCAGGHKIHCLLPSRIPGDSTDCTSMLWHHSLVCEILFWSLDMRFFAIGTGCEALANNLSNGKEGTLDNPPFRLFQNDQNKKMDSMFYSLWSKMSDETIKSPRTCLLRSGLMDGFYVSWSRFALPPGGHENNAGCGSEAPLCWLHFSHLEAASVSHTVCFLPASPDGLDPALTLSPSCGTNWYFTKVLPVIWK